MHIDDYILIGMSQSLKHLSRDNGAFFRKWKAQSEINLELLRQDQQRSVAFLFSDGREIPAAQAIEEFQKLKIENVFVSEIDESFTDLPSHMEAGFANTSRTVIAFHLQGQQRIFGIRVLYSPPTTFKYLHLIELIEAQPIREKIWESLAEYLNPNLSLWGQPAVDSKSVKAYLSNPQRERDLEHMKSELLREVQIEGKLLKKPIVIPEKLEMHLQLMQPLAKEDFCFNYGPPVTGQDLIDLLEAQPDQPAMQSVAVRTFEALSEKYNHPKTWEDWKQVILGQDAETLRNWFSGSILQIVSQLSQAAGTKPVIPDHVKLIFTPQPAKFEGNPRAEARANFYDEPYLSMSENPVRWEVYAFVEVTGVKLKTVPTNFQEARALFENNLQRVLAFATRVQSRFSDVFEAALFLLNDSSMKNLEPTDEAKQKLLASMEARNLSEVQRRVVDRTFWVYSDFKKIGFPEDSVRLLTAYDCVRGVFGGMGSWNDEYFESEKDQAEYSAVSSALFESLGQLYISTLNHL